MTPFGWLGCKTSIHTNKLYIHLWNVFVRFITSWILQIWYIEVLISRSISESPLDFEITSVDCTLILRHKTRWAATWENVTSIMKTRLFKYIENFTSKNWKFSDKKQKKQNKKTLRFFIFLRGDSNEYPQSMFLSRNKNNNVYPCKPQFYYIKVWFKGVKNI